MTNYLYGSPGGVTPVQLSAQEDTALQAILAKNGNTDPAPNYYDIYSPTGGVVPTRSNGSNCTPVGPTPVIIEGETWQQIVCTYTTSAATPNIEFQWHTPITIPPSFDTVTVEFQVTGGRKADSANVTLLLGTEASYTTGVVAAGSLNQAAARNVSQSDTFSCTGRMSVTWSRADIEAATGKVGWTNSNARDQIFSIMKIRFALPNNSSAGAAPWTNATSTTIAIRSVRVGTAARKGRLCIIADDGPRNWLRRGAPILARHNIRHTMAIIGSLIGTNTNYATLPELRAFRAGGNECVAHGPNQVSGNLFNTGGGDHALSNSNFATPALANLARVADCNISRDLCLDNGLCDANGAACYVWPQGVYNDGSGETSMLDAMYAAGYRLGRGITMYPSSDGVAETARHLMNLRWISPVSHHRFIGQIIGHNYVGAANTRDDKAETANIARVIDQIRRIATTGLDGFLMFHECVPRGSATGPGNIYEIETDRLEVIAQAIAQMVAAGTLECQLMSEMV